MLWLVAPQTHAKESRGWRRNGCRHRSSSGSPPWPERSTPASRCGSSHSAPGCSSPAAAAPSPVGCAACRTEPQLQALLLPARQRRTQGPGDRRGVAPHPPAAGLAGDGPGTPLVFGIDDSPTKRYGPHVKGAGKHHNPTPGPAGSPFLYGHVWVCLDSLVRHPLWGAIALPILSHLYIRAKDIGCDGGVLRLGVPHQAGAGRRQD